MEGCLCKAGYLRDENGTCVTVDKCVGKFANLLIIYWTVYSTHVCVSCVVLQYFI